MKQQIDPTERRSPESREHHVLTATMVSISNLCIAANYAQSHEDVLFDIKLDDVEPVHGWVEATVRVGPTQYAKATKRTRALAVLDCLRIVQKRVVKDQLTEANRSLN